MTAKPQALAAIPRETALNWIAMRPIQPGTIVGKCVAGCRTNGGTISPSKCPSCSRGVAWKYRYTLAQLDLRASGR